MDPNSFITSTQKWVDNMVIGQKLCPFAAPVQETGNIRYAMSSAKNAEELWPIFLSELDTLISSDRSEIETTLLIHPFACRSFDDFLDFIENATAGIEEVKLDGIIQLVGFHPEYCFADSEPTSVENYTNRSPYPMIHLLREVSVSEAVSSFPDTQQIPARNMARLRKLGLDKVRSIRESCFSEESR